MAGQMFFGCITDRGKTLPAGRPGRFVVLTSANSDGLVNSVSVALCPCCLIYKSQPYLFPPILTSKSSSSHGGDVQRAQRRARPSTVVTKQSVASEGKYGTGIMRTSLQFHIYELTTKEFIIVTQFSLARAIGGRKGVKRCH